MKKVFISQPTKGLTEDEIKEAREKAIREAKRAICDDGEEMEILDSYFGEYEASEYDCRIPLKYLAKSIELLAEADAAYFAEGWMNARGCRIEHMCADAYDIPWYQPWEALDDGYNALPKGKTEVEE